MKQRDFIAALGGAAAWPFAAYAPRSPRLVLSSRTEQRAEQAGVYAGRILKG